MLFRSRREDDNPLPDRIVQKVVYVGQAKWQPQTTIHDQGLNYSFEFVDVRKLDAKRLLETGDLGDAVVAVLANDGTDADVVRAILNKIAQAPVSEGADALAQLITLSQLRGARQLVEQEYAAMPITISVEDSKILRPPIDHAYEEGLAKGKAEGKAEGKIEGKAEAIAAILRRRFAEEVPADLTERLSHFTPEALDEILDKTMTSRSIAEALSAATSTKGPR